MALTSIRNRIRKAQAINRVCEETRLIAGLIARGAYYDELTDEEKNAYCLYIGNSDREGFESILDYFHSGLHFRIEPKPKPATEAQFRENIREVEAIMQGYIDEYNRPEAKAKREQEYQELQKIGELRKAAFDRGEKWDAYPLPWERKEAAI